MGRLSVIAALPRISHAELTGGQKIAVVAPHPDDETLGCGGLLAASFASTGAHVVCVTDGSASHKPSPAWPAGALADTRRQELYDAVAALGGTKTDVTWMGLPDGRLYLSSPDQLADRLLASLICIGASCIFVPALEDHHEDHKAIATAAKLLRAKMPDCRFYVYPVWSRFDDPLFYESIAEFSPVCLDTTRFRTAKRAALFSHASQMGKVLPPDTEGFVMPPAFIELFLTNHEIFWAMR